MYLFFELSTESGNEICPALGFRIKGGIKLILCFTSGVKSETPQAYHGLPVESGFKLIICPEVLIVKTISSKRKIPLSLIKFIVSIV